VKTINSKERKNTGMMSIKKYRCFSSKK